MRSLIKLSVAAALGVTACSRGIVVGNASVPSDYVASVTMRSASGDSIGALRVVNAANGAARLVGSVSAIPAGAHGIHAHAVGRCDAPAFTSAGAHFNPGGKQHGLQNAMGAHAGDAPNITADAAMRANVDVTFAVAASTLLDADGTAIVIHAAPDDQRTDPSGNSGARIACGVLVPR